MEQNKLLRIKKLQQLYRAKDSLIEGTKLFFAQSYKPSK